MDFIGEVGRLNFGKGCTACVKTFGCQMNERESEVLEGMLEQMGYELGDDEETADLVLYNTCCVRETAENKVFGKLGFLKGYKVKQPDKIVVFCGCMPQRDEVLAELAKNHRHIDIIFGTFNRGNFPRLLFEFLTERRKVKEILTEAADGGEFGAVVHRKLRHKAGVVVMRGCDNFCSYCIVPHVRGREFSRSVEEILDEVQALVQDDVKEVLLLGQNVNSYAYDFAELLRAVKAVDGLRRLRFLTSHPKDLNMEIVYAMRDCGIGALHLPVQSGSDKVLAAMNRKYTRERYLELVAEVRAIMPEIAITTDIIVGFPGESEEDFADTLDLVRQADFAGAFTFLYSDRSGTAAARFGGRVPKEVAKERFDRLLAVLNPMQLAYNSKYMGEVVEVMSDGGGSGRTVDNLLVHFDGVAEAGEVLLVKVVECRTFYLKGEVCSA